MSRIERGVLFGLPALCGMVLVFAVVGPGARRSVLASRALAIPVAGARRVAVRVQVVRRLRDVEVSAPGPVTIAWRDAAGELGRAACTADDEGWADAVVALERPMPERATLVVARGELPLGSAEVRARDAFAEVDAATCEAATDGGSVLVCVPRGTAVPELPERVLVERRRRAEEPPAELSFEATGGDVVPLGRLETACGSEGCLERWAFAVTARAPHVALGLELRAGERRITHEGVLPLRPGGLWLDPAFADGAPLRVRAATPSPRAYLAVATAEGRIWGATIPLAVDAAGMAEGTVLVPDVVRAAPAATLLVASDPAEAGGFVVGWPLGGDRAVERVPLAMLFDAVPDAQALEEGRMRAVRFPVVAAILTSAVAVLAVLAARVRRARRRLEAHLAGRGEPATIAHTPLGLGLLLLAALAVAFGVLAVVAARG